MVFQRVGGTSSVGEVAGLSEPSSSWPRLFGRRPFGEGRSLKEGKYFLRFFCFFLRFS